MSDLRELAVANALNDTRHTRSLEDKARFILGELDAALAADVGEVEDGPFVAHVAGRLLDRFDRDDVFAFGEYEAEQIASWLVATGLVKDEHVSRYRLRIDQNDFGSGHDWVSFWHEGPSKGDRVTVCEPESGQEWDADIIEVPGRWHPVLVAKIDFESHRAIPEEQ